MIHDATLLRRYAEIRDEAAFAELVRRHLDGVYSIARRRVGGDAHLAEDVAQQVFLELARKAKRLAAHPVLAGWLFTTTRNAAANVVRGERRREARDVLPAHLCGDVVINLVASAGSQPRSSAHAIEESNTWRACFTNAGRFWASRFDA
ncbi:MAG: sigma factor [Opitutaceae bacterium]